MARKGFETKITRARFVVGPFSGSQMATLGGILRDSMRERIQSGLNVMDAPAKPLQAAYAKGKSARGRQPIRDWANSGNTLRAMAVLKADENRAVIGFNNPIAGRVAYWNNLRERAFGVSPRDRQRIVAATVETARQARVVTIRRAS